MPQYKPTWQEPPATYATPAGDCKHQRGCRQYLCTWLVVPVIRRFQSPTWIWLVSHLHLHLPLNQTAPRSTRLHKQIAQDSKGKPTCTQTSGTQPPGSCTLTTCHPLVRDRDNSSPLRLFLKVSGLIPRGPLGSKHESHVTTTLGTGGGPVSCVQLSEGGFQVVYHLGLLSGFSGVVTLAVRFGYGIHPLPQSSSPSQEHSRSAWPATSEA